MPRRLRVVAEADGRLAVRAPFDEKTGEWGVGCDVFTTPTTFGKMPKA